MLIIVSMADNTSRRKPSVAASRRFSCTGAFDLKAEIQNSNHNHNHNHQEKTAKKIIWNGIDATPLPLLAQHSQSYSVALESGIHFHRDVSKVTALRGEKKTGVNWIEHVLKDCEDKHNLLASRYVSSTKWALPGGQLLSDGYNKIMPRSDSVSEGKLDQSDYILHETETMYHFKIGSSVIPNDSHVYNEVKERNLLYRQRCQRQRYDCPGKFCERTAQTFHLNSRSVGMNSIEINPETVESSSQCNAKVVTNNLDESMVESLTSAAIATEGCVSNVGPPSFKPYSKLLTLNNIILLQTRESIFQTTSMKESLRILEYAVQQNLYAKHQLKYRAAPNNTGIDKNSANMNEHEKVNTELLFSFKCKMTLNREVLCLDWHKTNTDILAVGYSDLKNKPDECGMVMLWSLRNSSFPEKIIKTVSSVTTLDFSLEQPSLLAVGLKDGRIILFDTAKDSTKMLPIFDSSFLPGRHMRPISQVRWIVDQGPERKEYLISLSVDGRVLRWSLKKGLSITPLMTLKRKSKSAKVAKLSNKAPGLCLDFPKHDGNSMMYLVGSDDGSLYHCSRAYTEHHLSSIQGHYGPVTKIKCSPFLSNIFLTSSADSTMKLWSITPSQEKCVEELTLQPIDLMGGIDDISWSPRNATLFALAASDGRVEMWDISKSTLDPLITPVKPSDANNGCNQTTNSRTVVHFTADGGNLVIGDNKGNVHVLSVNEQIMNKQVCVSDNNSEADRLRCILHSERLVNIPILEDDQCGTAVVENI